MLRSALLTVGLCLALTACGGGKREAQPSTRSAFLAAANRICTQAVTRAGRLARLRALHPPAAAVDLYLRWIAAEKNALAAAEELARPSGTKPPEGDPHVALAIAEGKATGYARRLGAKSCVRMPG